MRGIVTGFFLLWSCMTGLFTLSAQELHAAVTVNSSAVQGSSRELFRSLEESLQTLLNGQRWSDRFTPSDRKIRCSFNLLITEQVTDESFGGELYVHSTRAGEGGRPGSTLLVVRDREAGFTYSAYQPLYFDLYNIRDNLTALVAYYACLILGLDADASAPLGGSAFFRKMEQIASAVQPYGWKGWEMNQRQSNRTAIAVAFNEGSLEQYRLMWYRFHSEPRLTTAAEAVEVLYSLHRERPGHILLTLFGDARLPELVTILVQGDSSDREHWSHLLQEIYPTRADMLEMLRE